MPIPQYSRLDFRVSGRRRRLIIRRGNLISGIMTVLTQVTTFGKGQFDRRSFIKISSAASSRPITSTDSCGVSCASFVNLLPAVKAKTYNRELISSRIFSSFLLAVENRISAEICSVQ